MRNYMQTLCPSCGQLRQVVSHRGGQCDVVTRDMRQALVRYATTNGKRWKSKLCVEWERACDGIADLAERSLLQQCRNKIGPTRLYKIKIPKAA